jgi:hypothetical protein
MWRRSALVAHGGWGGIYGGEDVFTMAAVTSIHHSYYVDFETFRYRKHAEQITRERYYRSTNHQYMEFTQQRIAALRELGLAPEEK